MPTRTAKEDASPVVRLVPVDELHNAPWNPRTSDRERQNDLRRSMESDPAFLRLRPILATASGEIYAGNLKFRTAIEMGLTHVWAVVDDVSDELAYQRAVRDNLHWGGWEEDELAALLERLRSDGAEIDHLGFDERELQQLLDRLNTHPVTGDPDEVPALPDEPVTKPGDVWLLGEHRHRLVCGNATDPQDIALLMGADKASCVWTDPPYGVEYVGGTEKKLTIKNDHAEGLDALLAGSFSTMDSVLADGAAIYIAHPTGPLSMTFMSNFVAQGWRFHQSLVWVKDSLVPGHCDYQQRHEGVLFGYKPAQGRRGRGARGWYGDNSATSVFEVPRPKSSPDHPTSKPVELITAMIKNSSRTDEIILDLFAGSGSTLIAAEQLGRLSYNLELDPRYADVAVRRWERITGKTAQRIEAK